MRLELNAERSGHCLAVPQPLSPAVGGMTQSTWQKFYLDESKNLACDLVVRMEGKMERRKGQKRKSRSRARERDREVTESKLSDNGREASQTNEKKEEENETKNFHSLFLFSSPP